jgi:hypothetical protein
VIGIGYEVIVPDITARPDARRAAFILTIWSDTTSAAKPDWRGYLERGDGQRLYFGTLADLGRLLVEVAGWVDPAQSQAVGP